MLSRYTTRTARPRRFFGHVTQGSPGGPGQPRRSESPVETWATVFNAVGVGEGGGECAPVGRGMALRRIPYKTECLFRVFLTVAPDGAVLPCQTAREIPQLSFPTVHEHSLVQIWFDDPVFRRFRGYDWMPEPCRSCERRELDFGGCRCQAFLLTGDPAATDPVCQLSPQHHLVERALTEAEQTSGELQFRVMRVAKR